jgi:hypothetical protein
MKNAYYVRSVSLAFFCLSVRPSACISKAPIGEIAVKFDSGTFYGNMCGDSQYTGYVEINYRTILQNHIFTNTEQIYITSLPFESGMFAVSYSDHDVQITVGMRAEPPQNC